MPAHKFSDDSQKLKEAVQSALFMSYRLAPQLASAAAPVVANGMPSAAPPAVQAPAPQVGLSGQPLQDCVQCRH